MTETEALHAAHERAHARALSLLPADIRRVAEVIGIPLAMRLLDLPKPKGRSHDVRVVLAVHKAQSLRRDMEGFNKDFPPTAAHDSVATKARRDALPGRLPLVAVLGWDAAEKLCQALGYTELRLGNGGDIKRRAMHDQITGLAAKGLPVSYVAKMVGVTPQTVRNVIKSGRGASGNGDG